MLATLWSSTTDPMQLALHVGSKRASRAQLRWPTWKRQATSA